MQVVEIYDRIQQKEVDSMKENRGLKNRIAISNAIDKSLYEKLKQYSNDTGIPISKLLDKSIAMFLESVERN